MLASEGQRSASPFRLNLEQQRKRAKELLKGLRAGEAAAIGRFRVHHPRGSDLERAMPSAGAVRLSEAQLVVARELGVSSWARLKAHIATMDRSWTRIQEGNPAPDRDKATLHLRCGSDIEEGLQQAGFSGDFLEYSDPLCQGPVRDEAGWLEERADFIARAYGGTLGMDRAEIDSKLRRWGAGCGPRRPAMSGSFSGSSTTRTINLSWPGASRSSPRAGRAAWS